MEINSPKLPICQHGILIISIKLILNIIYRFALEKSQKEENKHCENRCLDKLINHNLDSSRGRQWIFRRWECSVKKEVIKVIPWCLEYKPKECKSCRSCQINACLIIIFTLIFNRLSCKIRCTKNNTSRDAPDCDCVSSHRVSVVHHVFLDMKYFDFCTQFKKWGGGA